MKLISYNNTAAAAAAAAATTTTTTTVTVDRQTDTITIPKKTPA